jgi:DNA-binding transcriptional MocR family regulator
MQQALMLEISAKEKQTQKATVICATAWEKHICYGQNTGFLYLFFYRPRKAQYVMSALPQSHPPPIYQQLATHYRGVIHAGALRPGDRMPSLRTLMRQHQVSLSTALQLSRQLEDEGWLEARPRSGYFVRTPMRRSLSPVAEPMPRATPDPAQYVGIHARVSEFVARRRSGEIKHNFAEARCAPELYPMHELKTAAARALRQHPNLLVNPCPARGLPEFRQVLAQRAMHWGMSLSPDDIQVTNGCIEALNIALRAVAQPGDTIAVESPTFYGLLQVLESLGMRAVEIPTSPVTGMSMDALDFALRTYPGIKAVVVVPHLQNPLGSIMPLANKRSLLELCEKHDIALIEDDTYSELMNEHAMQARAPKAIKALDQSGRVIYCASLHKILAPGLRLGWIAAGRWHARVEMLKYAQTRSNDMLPQLAAGEFIASSAYERHLRKLRSRLKLQREQTAEAIATYFPSHTRMNMPDGGLALWVEMPKQLSSQAVFDAALREHILVAPGQLFSNSQHVDHYLRINCGWPFDAHVEQGLQRLGKIIKRMA